MTMQGDGDIIQVGETMHMAANRKNDVKCSALIT